MEPRIVRFPTSRRLALMGGIYGNLPSLWAAVEDARRRGCDRLLFLGDATGCCGHSGEVLAVLRQHFDLLLQGNHEEEAIAGSLECGCGYDDPEDERLSCLAHSYAMRGVDDAHRRWIAGWAKQALVLTPGGALLLCHGSPERVNEFLYESRLDDARVLKWLESYGAVGLACTHTGLSWVRRLPGDRFAVNCGVVGKPENNGDSAVHYAILEPDPSAPWTISIQRVEYDHLGWADQLNHEGVDPIFTQPLRDGRWTTGLKSLPAAERRKR